MSRAWVLGLLLVSPGWADDRETVARIFRRPEFLWKSEEKQPPPPVCKTPIVSEDDDGSGLPDRSGLGRSDDSGGLLPPEEPEHQETPSAEPKNSPSPAAQAGSPDPQESANPSSSPTPTAQPTPASQSGPSEPEAAPTPSAQPGSAEPDSAPIPSPSATPELPDHPPPPLDYPVQPGLREKLARWWSGLFGRPAGTGLRHILLLMRDLAALLLLIVFVRQLLPLLRQLRNWFKSDPPAKVSLEENSPEPEILPEWQQLWRQAGDLQLQGRSALAQRMSYLAVLAFLDHGGHIRYRPSGTNREYLATLSDPLRDPFARLTRRFERCRYGGQAPEFEEFQAACREVLPP